MDFVQRYGKWALVVGGSTGLGEGCAQQAASRGMNVVLVARRMEVLDEAADRLRSAYGAEVRTMHGDVSQPDCAAGIVEAVRELDLGLFVYNAAGLHGGPFAEMPLEGHLLNIQANVTTPTVLCYELGRRMIAQGKGAIALVSSIAALVGCQGNATYSATKAYEWILAESLYAEYGPDVDVVGYILGATATPTYLGSSFGANMDLSLADRVEVDDPLQTMLNRQIVPTLPEDAALTLFEHLGDGPVVFEDPIDQRTVEKLLAMSRADAVDFMTRVVNAHGPWRLVHEER